MLDCTLLRSDRKYLRNMKFQLLRRFLLSSLNGAPGHLSNLQCASVSVWPAHAASDSNIRMSAR